jgi:glycosyltransferase involved in cell wall biosynthesis
MNESSVLKSSSPRALYAAFDRVPSPKGAATHIERFARTLFETFEGGVLHVLGDDQLPAYERDGNVQAWRFHGQSPNFLERTRSYGNHLSEILSALDETLEICHFRDPWSGVPILDRPHKYKTVYEINGLPSIELPGIFPLLAPRTLEKIRKAEEFCWKSADAIVVPSRTIAENLVRLGAPGDRITVIPNGADPSSSNPPRPPDAPERYAIYFGALQAWQGLDILLQAFARLADLDLKLVICSSSHPRLARPYRKLATRLGLDERVVWKHALCRVELARWVAHAKFSFAPLVECARNLEQGCCPLKILESMALGVTVIASDLPAVREILTEGAGWLVPPGRPAELARAVRLLIEHPRRASELAREGRLRLEQGLTWSDSVHSLRQLYISVLELPSFP